MIGLARGGYSAQAVQKALHAPNRKLDFRYELLTVANVHKAELSFVKGASVSYNSLNDIKRTAMFIVRDDGTINFLSDRIKPYVRLWMGNEWVEFPMGVFILSTAPRKVTSQKTVVRDVEAYDLGQILADDKVVGRHTVASGQNYIGGTNGVADILTGAGITAQNLTATSKTLPADVDWPPGTPKLQIINDLLRAINYTTLWFDENGVATAAPYLSPADRGSEYTYADDENSVMFPEPEQSMDLFHVPNCWPLAVSEPDRTPLSYTYTNTNANSPTSTVNRGRTIMPDQCPIFVDAADLETLQAMAQRMAFEASQVYDTIEWESGIMPMHSHSDVYTFANSTLGVSAKYCEQSWEMELKRGGKMKHSARRVVSV